MGVLFSCCDKEPTFGTKVRSIVDRIKFSDDEEENLLKRKILSMKVFFIMVSL